MESDEEHWPSTAAEGFFLTPIPVVEPHGLPLRTPSFGGETAAELRPRLAAAEAKERAAAEARLAIERQFEREQGEYDRIAAETIAATYDRIAAAVDTVLTGFGALARELEAAETDAMQRGSAVDPEAGAAFVRDRLRSHRAERLRPFLNLLRDDQPRQQ